MVYQTREDLFNDYYIKQARGLATPLLHNTTQHGGSIGGVLGSLFRAAVPVLKSSLGGIGKTALQTGVNIVNDVASGGNWKTSLKKHGVAAGKSVGKQLVRNIGQRMRGAGAPSHGGKRVGRRAGLKRKKSQKSVTRGVGVQRKKRRTREPDIFD